MADPLLMLGPGGDFVTRFDVQGHDLLRNVGQSMEQQSDGESGGGVLRATAGCHGARRAGLLGVRRGRGCGTLAAGPISRGMDVFEHAAPRAVTLRLYSPQASHAPGHHPAGANVASDSVLASIITSIESWLAAQQRTLAELSHSFAAMLPGLHRPRTFNAPYREPEGRRVLRGTGVFDNITTPTAPTFTAPLPSPLVSRSACPPRRAAGPVHAFRSTRRAQHPDGGKS